MKINYNGQELETITEGYWPEGVTLVYSNNETWWEAGSVNAICLHNGRAFYSDGTCGGVWKHWAILPHKPTTRRLTNREAFGLCRKGWDMLYRGDVAISFIYPLADENEAACEYCEKLRAPGSDEWLEPTNDLLEVGK